MMAVCFSGFDDCDVTTASWEQVSLPNKMNIILKTRSYYRKESAAVTHKLDAKFQTQ